jgi:MFS family permease
LQADIAMLTHRLNKFYYGWYIAVALAITETVSYGVMFYSKDVFLIPMEDSLGWSRSELTGGFSLALLISVGMAVPVGYWLDKHGARLLMSLGSVGATILVLMWSQVTTFNEFIIIWGLLGFCYAAVLYEPAFAVIATWFVHKRGTAMAIVTFVAGLASTIFIPLSDALLVAFGWQKAIFILGVILGVVTIPLHVFILRRRPEDMGLFPDGELVAPQAKKTAIINVRSVLKSRFFWILTLAFAISTLSMAAVRGHFIPLLISIGINPSTAALASGSIGIMQVAGRIFFAPIERHFSSKSMVIGVFMLMTLSLAILLLGGSPILIIIFIVLYGMAVGTHTLAKPLIVADVYGVLFYGRISSVMTIFIRLSLTLAPFGAGIMFDLFGSYTLMLYLVTGLSALSVILIWFLPASSD